MLLAWLFAPAIAWLLRTWQVHPYYSHGPIVPIVALFILWRRRARLRGAAPSDLGLLLLGVGLLLHLLASRYEAHPASLMAFLLVLAGCALLVGGRPALRAAAFPLGLLALSVPLPWVERLAPPLAGAVAQAAAGMAGAIGIPVIQAGAQLSVADGSFVVGAPCSGLRSLVALCSLAVVVAGLLPATAWRRIALVALAVPLALMANGLRLVGLLWMADRFGAERGLALFHGLASPLAFLLAILALLAFAQRILDPLHVRA